MNQEQLQKKYERIAFKIEQRFAESDVPSQIQAIYLPSVVIAGRSFERFYKFWRSFHR